MTAIESEQYRAAGRVRVGDEIRINCRICDAQHWAEVTDVLHITAPARIVTFTVADGGLACLAAHSTVTVPGGDEVMSRRDSKAASRS